MSIEVEISLGEFLDKLTILEIKAARVREPDKLANIHKELDQLRARWRESGYARADVKQEIRDLRTVNESLWEIEDRIREKEARGEFDADFIELARAVYRNNDRRAALKRAINHKLGSGLVEEKSYTGY
jgi:predicted  nucleic acid-binding Zn-ribbon protein